MRRISVLTCNRLGISSTFASRDEDDISLASIRVLILEEEEVIDAIIPQRRGFDYQTNRACEALFNNKVLLSADLFSYVNQECHPPQKSVRITKSKAGTERMRTAYAFEEIQEVLSSFVSNQFGIKSHMRSHGI